MRYLALACDYDGTLACDGQVSADTLAALQRLLATGRKLILVSGRQLEDLFSVCPGCDIFEWIVAENGAVLYHSPTRKKELLANPPSPKLIARLRERGVPLSDGDAIISTHQPHEITVEQTIRELGLNLQLIFNKGAVMVLPSGTTKATGLGAALREMGLSPHNVVAVGDAENDDALLSLCECSAAVANALPMLQEKADFVTADGDGAGVTELIDEIIASDLRERWNANSRFAFRIEYFIGGSVGPRETKCREGLHRESSSATLPVLSDRSTRRIWRIGGRRGAWFF